MSLPPGTTLGPYEVVSFVGAGGMGEVYRARDARLERDVALKVLSPRLASDPEALGRFIREARTLSRLSHPNVCTVYDVGDHGDTHFIVMEFLEGRTLAAQLGRGQLAIDQAVEYALQIADGLSKAHAIGVIHRDLKPSNVMLTTDGFVKILDFGLSKYLDSSGSVNTTLVTVGSGPVVGTIAYMAPEQTEGARADVRSDIFSFGVMLYEMLTGVRPFDGANVVSTIRRINDATPRPLHEVRPDIPPALAAVIAKALEKDPTHRFQSVSELRAQLRAGAMRSPVPGEQPLSSIDTPAAPRRPVVVQTAWRNAAIAAVAIAVMAAGFWSGNRGRSVKPNEANTTAAPASAIASEELTQLARRGQALLQRYDRPKNIDQAIELFREVLAHDDSNALAHAGMAEAYLRKDGITPDPQMMKQAADSAGRAVALNGDLAIAHLAVAMVALREGRRDDALRALERARDLEPRNVDGLRYFGEYYRTTDPPRAEELLRAAVAGAPDDWRSHFSLGLFYYRSANYTNAISAWERARTLSPDNMVVLANLGGVYHAVDRTDEAATIFQRALEIEPRSSIYNNLATMRFFQGRLADAAAAFEKAIELNPGYSLYWGNLGDTYRWMPGKEAKARESFTTAIKLAEEGLRANPSDVDLRSRVAGYLAKRGDIQQALEQVREIENVKRSPAVYYKTAVVYEIAGRRDAALRDLEVAMKGGYSMREIANEAEFGKLRTDARYQRLLHTSQSPATAAK